MDTEAKTSKAAVFGRNLARLYKKILAAERQLIVKSGSHKRWVKGTLSVVKAALALLAVAASLWALVFLVPLILLGLLIANSDRYGDHLSGIPRFPDTGERDGYRYGAEGFGYYVGMFRVDSDGD